MGDRGGSAGIGGYYDHYPVGAPLDTSSSTGYHRGQQLNGGGAGVGGGAGAGAGGGRGNYGLLDHQRSCMPPSGQTEFSVHDFALNQQNNSLRGGDAGGGGGSGGMVGGGVDIKPIVVVPKRAGHDSYDVTSSGGGGFRPVPNDRANHSGSPPFGSLSPSTWSDEMERRRPRSDRKPIAPDLKDEKYFERRHRNNDAAKRSRDARKQRMDAIMHRSNILEHENLILRAQRSTLYDQLCTMREMAVKRGGGGGGLGGGSMKRLEFDSSSVGGGGNRTSGLGGELKSL